MTTNKNTVYVYNFEKHGGFEYMSVTTNWSGGFFNSPLLYPLRVLRSYWNHNRIKRCEYGGFVLYYHAGSTVGRFVAAGRGWDTNLVPILTTLFHEDSPVIAEVGTNIGGSLLSMQLAKPKAQFYCFEPSRRFLPILERNVRENGWNNVRVEPLMLSSEVEELSLYNSVGTASPVARDYDENKFIYAQSTRTTTLDLYLSKFEKLDFLKVDTDGFDFDVLLGGRTTIKRLKPVLYFEFEEKLLKMAGRDPVDFLNYLKKLGYSKFLLLSNIGQPLTITGEIRKVTELSSQGVYLDVLAVHRKDPNHLNLLGSLFKKISDEFSV